MRHLLKKFKGAPLSADAANTTRQLKEWRKSASAFNKAFVPKIAQHAAKEMIKKLYETNKARIEREKTTSAPGPTSNDTTTLTTSAPESAANQSTMAASEGALRLAAGSAGQGGGSAGARTGAPSSAGLLAAGGIAAAAA